MPIPTGRRIRHRFTKRIEIKRLIGQVSDYSGHRPEERVIATALADIRPGSGQPGREVADADQMVALTDYTVTIRRQKKTFQTGDWITFDNLRLDVLGVFPENGEDKNTVFRCRTAKHTVTEDTMR